MLNFLRVVHLQAYFNSLQDKDAPSPYSQDTEMSDEEV